METLLDESLVYNTLAVFISLGGVSNSGPAALPSTDGALNAAPPGTGRCV